MGSKMMDLVRTQPALTGEVIFPIPDTPSGMTTVNGLFLGRRRWIVETVLCEDGTEIKNHFLVLSARERDILVGHLSSCDFFVVKQGREEKAVHWVSLACPFDDDGMQKVSIL